MGERWLFRALRGEASKPPEIIQSSAMDCGPAALAALLGAFGMDADVGALRDVCATDVDGTSIDELEEVALGLGLEAQQLVVPWEQLAAVPERYLPALLLTRTPDGFAHVVCAWRWRRGAFELVDPAIGRRRVRRRVLAREIYLHELEAPASAWSEYARSDDATEALLARLRGLGRSEAQARAEVDAAHRAGPVDGVGALLARLSGEEAGGGVEAAPAVERVDGGDGTVRVRGAVTVRVTGRRADHEPPPRLSAVLGEPQPSPLVMLRDRALRRPVALTVVALAALVTGAATVAEALAARHVLQSGSSGGLTVMLVAVAVALAAGGTLSALVARMGRGVERDVLTDLFARVGRLGDGYVRTRPVGDLTERAHAVRLTREAIELGGVAVQRAVEVALTAGAMVVLAPASWPAALALALLAALVPPVTVRALREGDLRVRAVGGVLAQLLTDALGGAGPVRSHRGAAVVLAWQRPLLDLWERAAQGLAVRAALTRAVLAGPGLLLAAIGAGLALHAGESPATALVVAGLGFFASSGIADIAAAARRLASLRSVLARLLDPLRAPLLDPEPLEPAAGQRGGIGLRLEGVDVALGGHPVLSGLDLELRPGEHVAVVGPSGAGKSTLIGVLGGWLRPVAGSVAIDGQPLEGEALARLRAATAWSDPHARLADLPAVASADQGAAPAAPAARIRLAAVGLRHLIEDEATVGEGGARLSAPDAQRLRLARALGRPHARLVLLDEALRGLADDERARLLALARHMWRDATLVHVTHHAAEAADFPRALVIGDGRLVEDGDPRRLAREPGSRFVSLLEAQRGLARRLGDRRRWPAVRLVAGPQPPSSDGAAPRAEPQPGERFVDRRTVLTALASLVCAIGAITLVVVAGGRLGSGINGEGGAGLGWLPAVLVILAAASGLAALGVYADGYLGATVGRRLRYRALAATLRDDPGRHAGEGVGARLGRVLDLETVERGLQGTGNLLALGLTQAIVAMVVLAGTTSAVAPVLVAVGLVVSCTVGAYATRAASAANARRRLMTADLLDLMLGLRAATIYARPAASRRERAGRLDRLMAAERRHDTLRVVLLAVLPRAGVVAVLSVLAADPPTGTGRLAAGLGAVLLALAGLERLGIALGNIALATAAGRSAHDLLFPRPPAPALHARPPDGALLALAAHEGEVVLRPGEGALLRAPAQISAAHLLDGLAGLHELPWLAVGRRADARVARVPAPGEDVLFHQAFVANAVLATGSWPPTATQWRALDLYVPTLGLADLVARMPSGLAQPLGDTGWRLSEGERARFSLLRALLAGPQLILADSTLQALDPPTAHVILDLLERHPAAVVLTEPTDLRS